MNKLNIIYLFDNINYNIGMERLLKILFKDYDVYHDSTKNPDIIVIPRAMKSMKWNLFKKYYNKVPYILWSKELEHKIANYKIEPIVIIGIGNAKEQKYLGTYSKPIFKNTKYFNVPLPLFAPIKLDLHNIREYNNLKRPYNVALITRHNFKQRYELLEAISKHVDKCYSMGKDFCNFKHPKLRREIKWNNTVKVYSDFYFVISIDNHELKECGSEKIMNAFRAGSIPICRDLPILNEIAAISDRKSIKEYFNPNALINVSDFNTFEDVGIYIKNLLNDKKKLYKMMQEPVFKNNILPDNFKLFENDVGNYYNDMSNYVQNKYKNIANTISKTS